PAASAACHVANCVEDLTQIHRRFAPSLRRLGQQWPDPLPFFLGQVRRISLGLAGNSPSVSLPLIAAGLPRSSGVLHSHTTRGRKPAPHTTTRRAFLSPKTPHRGHQSSASC